MGTLKIFIKGKWFDEIAAKEKTIEYREVKPFWTARLYDKEGKRIAYKYIEFINGMKPDSRRMVTQYLGFSNYFLIIQLEPFFVIIWITFNYIIINVNIVIKEWYNIIHK
jgi:hypothetical protein